MKINTVVKRTGLTKRTIYFYIEEQLIVPKINPDNGYYQFSEEDVQRLLLLQQLRKADFSIKDIRDLLFHPSSAHIYLQKQIERLNHEEELLLQKKGVLQQISDQLPLQISYESFAETVQRNTFPEQDFSLKTDLESDAKLVCLYLWGTFLQDIEMTEYRQFFWEKLLHKTAISHDVYLYQLKDYLYSLPADQIDKVFAGRNLHINKIISLTPETLPEFAEEMELHIAHKSQTASFISFWKDNYKKQIETTTALYDSELNALAAELSPRFSVYCHNIHKCCDLIYEWLHSKEGETTYQNLITNLDGNLNLEANHHGEIAAMFTM